MRFCWEELTQVRRCAIAVLLLAGPLGAQSTATVPARSRIYDVLEDVSAWYPRRGVVLGERSLSRRQVDAMLRRLAVAIDSAPESARREWARAQLAAASGFGPQVDEGGHEKRTLALAWRADLIATDAVPEQVPSNSLGLIDAITPIQTNRFGWPEGRTIFSAAPTLVAGVQDWLAIGLEPRFSQSAGSQTDFVSEARLQRAYARGVVSNVAIRFGVDEMRWGQSPVGALFISSNAAPMPALSVGTDTCITLPWLFRLAGPTRATAFLADLGRSQDPPHAKLAGWQITIQPWSRFELGVAVLAHTGGSGGPQATFLQRLVDLFPVIDAFAPQHADLQISNKLAGGNLRLRFPELSGLDVYYELQIDDFDGRRLRSSLVDDAAHLLGARLPLLLRAGELTWRAEWHNTSLRLYEHAQFRSGVTYRDRIIGDPLGPNAKGGYLSATWQPTPVQRLELSLADESRDPSLYLTTSNNARDEGFRFVRLTDDPRYRRRKARLAFDRPVAVGAVSLAIGYDRVWRTGGAARGEWLAALAVRNQLFPSF